MVGEQNIKKRMGVIMKLTPLMLYRNTIKACKEKCECAICLEESKCIAVERKCSHKFHYICNTKWNKCSIKDKNNSEDFWKGTCPLCRQ